MMLGISFLGLPTILDILLKVSVQIYYLFLTKLFLSLYLTCGVLKINILHRTTLSDICIANISQSLAYLFRFLKMSSDEKVINFCKVHFLFIFFL